MDLLSILFALAAVVWVIHLIRVGSLALAALATLIVGTVFGPAFFAIDGPFQISADRVLWALVIGMAVVHWRLGWFRFQGLTRGDWVLLFLAAWLAISTQRGGPLPDQSSPVARWLFYFALPVGMYWIGRAVTLQSGELRRVFGGLVALSVYLSLVGWCEMRGWHGLVFPRYIVDPQIWEFYGRARGPLLNPAGNGIVMTIGLGAAVLLWREAGRVGKLLNAVAAVVIAAGMVATLTRGVWLGGLVALAVLAYWHVPRWVRVAGLVGVLLITAGAALGLKDQLLRFKRDKHLSAAEAEKSLQLRPLLAIVAWEMFQDRPLAGVGYGRYFAHSQPYHNLPRYGASLQPARDYMQHNVLLSILVDAGLIGVVPLVVLWMYWMACGWRLASRAGPGDGRPLDPEQSSVHRNLGLLLLVALCGYLVNGTFQDVSIIPMVHMYLFFLAGLAVGHCHRLPQDRLSQDAASRWRFALPSGPVGCRRRATALPDPAAATTRGRSMDPGFQSVRRP